MLRNDASRGGGQIGPVACLMLILASLLAAFPRVAAAQDQQQPAGQVFEVAGPAELLRGDERLAVRPGTTLRIRDRLRTGADGRVTVRLTGGSVLVVGPETTVAVERFGAPNRTGGFERLLSLVSGILRLAGDSPQAEAGLAVRTRTAIASVRSTDWVVQQTPEQTSVFVVEGQVHVRRQDGRASAVLVPGFGIDMGEEAPLADGPKQWGQGRVDATLALVPLP